MEIALLILNLTAFSFYGIDKALAQKNAWRISEKILLTLSLFGGIGAFLGMKIFHHKTQKTLFRVFVPICVVINALCFVILMRN